MNVSRFSALIACTALVAPTALLAGCGSGADTGASGANMPPMDSTARNTPAPTNNMPAQNNSGGGLVNKRNLMILAGAAAAYYAYKKYKENKGAQAANVQYYLSKNGRIYYRDPQTKRAIWVTPEVVRPVQLPYDQAQAYSNLRGYNNQNTGQTLFDLPEFSQGGGANY